MKYAAVIAIVCSVALVGLVCPSPADAGGSSRYAKRAKHAKHARVKGYTARRGGYSYTVEDSINTYGDSRNVYGATQSFRDPMLDRQTNAGPFDSGFFFDSGIAPRGGNSPYMN